MTAKEFNRIYQPGELFNCKTARGSQLVRTVGIAFDLPCGSCIEINRVPYLAKTETLTPPDYR